MQLDDCIRGLCDPDEPCAPDAVMRPAGVMETLKTGFERADKTLIGHLRQVGGKAAQAGATATIAVVKDGRLFVANVGDSQAVLCRRGAAVAIAHTHRVYGHGDDVTSEIERVKATGGWVRAAGGLPTTSMHTGCPHGPWARGAIQNALRRAELIPFSQVPGHAPWLCGTGLPAAGHKGDAPPGMARCMRACMRRAVHLTASADAAKRGAAPLHACMQVDDGRVCGVLAVSRAFGDREFKGEGLPSLLANGITKGYWDAAFAGQQAFTSDPVLVTPDVTETLLTPEDEFVIVASDGEAAATRTSHAEPARGPLHICANMQQACVHA